MNKIPALLAVVSLASCSAPTTPQLKHDAADFGVRPNVVVINGQRHLAWQLGSKPVPTSPVIRVDVVENEVHCYVHMFVSSHSNRPRRIKLPNKGNVFWLNPDGTRIPL